MQTAISFEGVLIHGLNDSPVQAGVDIARSMGMAGRIVIMAQQAKLEVVETFCGVHRIDAVDDIRIGTKRPGSGSVFQRQIEEFRASGVVIDGVLHADLGMVTWLMQQRIASLLFTAPGVTPPESRPDDSTGRQSWEQLDAEFTRRQQSQRLAFK